MSSTFAVGIDNKKFDGVISNPPVLVIVNKSIVTEQSCKQIEYSTQ